MRIFNVQPLYSHEPESSIITLSGSWTKISGTADPSLYTLTANVPFITPEDSPFIQVVGVNTSNKIAKWGSIVEATTSDGTITFIATSNASTSIDVLVKVIK